MRLFDKKSKYDLSEGQFEGANIYIESTVNRLPLIDGKVSNTHPQTLLSELAEWKSIHNESQTIVNALNTPLEFLTKYRLNPNNYYWLDEAGSFWQETCIPPLKIIMEGWKPQFAHTPTIDHVKEQISPTRLNEITRQLRHPDIQDAEITLLLLQLRELRGSFWTILTIADKRMIALIEALQPIFRE